MRRKYPGCVMETRPRLRCVLPDHSGMKKSTQSPATGRPTSSRNCAPEQSNTETIRRAQGQRQAKLHQGLTRRPKGGCMRHEPWLAISHPAWNEKNLKLSLRRVLARRDGIHICGGVIHAKSSNMEDHSEPTV